MLLPESIIGFFYTFHKIHLVHRFYRQYKCTRKSYVNYFHNNQSLQAHYHSLHQIQALLLLYTMKVPYPKSLPIDMSKESFIPRLFMYFQIINERLIRFSCIWPSRKTQCSIKIYRNNLFLSISSSISPNVPSHHNVKLCFSIKWSNHRQHYSQ